MTPAIEGRPAAEPQRVGRLVVWALAIAIAACGGGRIDPGFLGQIETAAPTPQTSLAVDTSPPKPFSRPKLVEIRADWCRFCRAAEPGIEAAYDPFQAKVERIILDVTDDATAADAERIAAHEGVGKFFAKYRGRTPTVAVFVAPDDGRLVHGDLTDPEMLSRELAFAVSQFGPGASSDAP